MDFFTHALDLFFKGGPVMYLLLGCSLYIVTIATERWHYYRQTSLQNNEFKAMLTTQLDKQHWNEALQLCEKAAPNMLASVASKGLKSHQKGSPVENALESAAVLAATGLKARLDDLSLIVTLSPLLGLLGTVIGMIQSFSVFNLKAGQPSAITGGVGEALIATATGLCVATLALLLHGYFSRRANAYISELEQIAALVLEQVSCKKAIRRDNHEIA